MKFKSNNYYCVIHKDFGSSKPIKCIIKVGDCNNKHPKSWMINIIRILDSHIENTFIEGTYVSWYEHWCTVLEEFDHNPTDAEILVYAL